MIGLLAKFDVTPSPTPTGLEVDPQRVTPGLLGSSPLRFW